MHKVPYISVIIPTYNMRYLLRNAVESLFKQSYPSDCYEIIVIDNSSSDGTGDMVHSLQESSPCVLKYYQKENEGPGSSRNLGIAKARGTVVAFTDSDCIVDQDWLKKGAAKMIDGIGIVQGKTIPNPNQTLMTFSRTQRNTKDNGMYQTCNIFYRKEAIDLVGGFSPDFCGLNRFGKPRWGGEDTDLAWRVKKTGWKSTFADESIVYHHIFPLRPWQVIGNLRKYQIQGLFYAMPYLVKKHPELRKHFYFRYFLSRSKAFFDIFFLSLVLGIFIHQIFFLFAFPYLALRSKDAFLSRPLKQYHRGLVVFVTKLLSDFVDFTLLFSGSIWNRSIIL